MAPRTTIDPDSRRAQILRTARAMAEREGWSAVSARALSTALGFTQPVLYRAVGSMPELQASVAAQGFEELSRAVADRRGLRLLAEAYLDFADTHPATYAAMFRLAPGLGFATDAASAGMQAAFAALVRSVGSTERAELAWAALHGMVELERSGRVPRAARTQRLAALVDALGRPDR